MSKRKSRSSLSVIVIAILAALTVLVLFADAPVDPSGAERLFSVPKGASTRWIAQSLADKGLVRSSLATFAYARSLGKTLKAGTYRLSPAMRAHEVIAVLEEGKQEEVRVTLAEGLSLSKVARRLESAGVVPAADFARAASDPAILREFGIPGRTAEGYLFPDTYFFPYGIAAEDAVRMMLRNFFARVPAIEGAPTDPARLFEAVTLASVVEREYRLDDEAPLIASVFRNRISIGMGLQSCATVEYIITEIEGKEHPTRLTAKDLEIKSDYNTYLWAGLPPGPISNPGTVALRAVFGAPRTNYLYFRLVDPETGKHRFTRSLEEHVEAGRTYYLKRAAGD